MKHPLIVIAGLGLIGGSIALGIKKTHPNCRIVGYDYFEDYRQKAMDIGLVDTVTDCFEEIAVQADIVFLAVPIKQIKAFMEILASLPMKKNVLVTDVGSTKSEVIHLADQLYKDKAIAFLGGHPMAGSHKTGPLAADVTLFENAYYILTSSQTSTAEHVLVLKDLLKGLNARFIEISAEEHDHVTSQVSHFPHVIAASLMEQAGEYGKEYQLTQHFAAGGFRDMTRIAESEPGMWTSILLSNKQAIIDRIQDFKERLNQVENFIRDEKESEIWHYFDTASKIRQQMNIHKRGGVDSSYDLFIDVPDKEDVILEVLELLRGISLVNVHINEENREDIYGVLQLSFKNKKDHDRAFEILSQKTHYIIKSK